MTTADVVTALRRTADALARGEISPCRAAREIAALATTVLRTAHSGVLTTPDDARLWADVSGHEALSYDVPPLTFGDESTATGGGEC